MTQRKRDNPGWNDAAGVSLNNPFAALAARSAPATVDVPDAATPAATPQPSPAHAVATPAKAVVRYERKGRGGKAVTVIAQLGVPAQRLDELCAEARKKLGCGGTVEDVDIVLQGDQRERAAAWLQALGVRKVTVAG